MSSNTASRSMPTQRTPLHALHLELQARMGTFAGYTMPLQYPAGLLNEHRHTRSQGAASLFDVSHMGQISVSGANAAAALERVLPIDVLSLPQDHQRYALLLAPHGGILDDLMVVRRAHDYLLIVNAARKTEDLQWLLQHIGQDCDVQMYAQQALLALQGPGAAAVLARLAPACTQLRFMQGMALQFQGAAVYATRSGYTGEDGFELSIHCSHAPALARWLLQQPEVQPAGLGARNSLRLEAGLCLYGCDMQSIHTPASARLQWSISKARRNGGEREAGFIGAHAVLPEISGGQAVSMVRVGLQALERVPVRDGTALHLPQSTAIGTVTSGLLSPTLNTPIAMAYVPPAHSAHGTLLHAMVRGRAVPMEVTHMPFVATRYCKS